MKYPCVIVLALATFSSPEFYQATHAQERPNIVVLLADDMGFGELQCLNPTRGKIKTPQLDAIARSGMVFTDAHSGSSVCTPTRYGLMTGRYAWRTRLQSGVLTGGQSLSWPAVVKAGSRSDQLVCLTDVIATVADILDIELPDEVAEDGYSFLPAL